MVPRYQDSSPLLTLLDDVWRDATPEQRASMDRANREFLDARRAVAGIVDDVARVGEEGARFGCALCSCARVARAERERDEARHEIDRLLRVRWGAL